MLSHLSNVEYVDPSVIGLGAWHGKFRHRLTVSSCNTADTVHKATGTDECNTRAVNEDLRLHT
jgi:hypothetical protein